MSPRLAWILLAAAAAVGLVALVVAARRDRPRPPAGSPAAVGSAIEQESGQQPPVRVELYFPGANGRLVTESREIEGSVEPSTLAARIVEALLEGPRNEPSYRPFPEDVSLGEVYFSSDGTAYVDLRSTASPSPPFEGTTVELLTLYSLVNSVVGNVPGARSLVVLWNGRQPRTFGGHIDTSRPLLPAPELAPS
jgi:Sporulation and spore germination